MRGYKQARTLLGRKLATADRLVAEQDWSAAHEAIVEAKALLDGVEAAFIEDLRASGRSWTELGGVFGGITRAGARQRYERVKGRSPV